MLTKEELLKLKDYYDDNRVSEISQIIDSHLETNTEIEKLNAEVALLRNVKLKAIRLLNDWRPDPEYKYLDCWREELYDAIKLAESKKEEGG